MNNEIKEELINNPVNNEEVKNWIKQELENIKENSFSGERLPSLKLEPNKVYLITIDFSKPFDSYEDTMNNSMKKIIPISYNDEKMIFWLNVKNPLYAQIMELADKGQTMFKIIRTGEAKETKYSLVND